MNYACTCLAFSVIAQFALHMDAIAQVPPKNLPEARTAGLDESSQQLRRWLFTSVKQTGPEAGDSPGMRGQLEGFVGREDLGVENVDASQYCSVIEGDVISAIIEQSRETNVVIINEDHSAPYHRQFIARVLTSLRAEGYAIYAAETFSPYTSLATVDVLANQGVYTGEPIFARTVRLAKSLGYQLVAYEQTVDQSNKRPPPPGHRGRLDPREEDQSANLIAAIFTSDPTAKVIIHVGGSHVLESPIPNADGGGAWMAAHLKKATGLDPLTISQTACLSPVSATVLANPTPPGTTYSDSSWVDIRVGHPELAFENGRPSWRLEAGDIAVPIPPDLLSPEGPLIVEARREDQVDAAIPVDRLLVFPNDTLPLLLPAGRYRIEAFNHNGLVSGPLVIEVSH